MPNHVPRQPNAIEVHTRDKAGATGPDFHLIFICP